MINPKELRIGNWVKIGDNESAVDYAHVDSIGLKGNCIVYHFDFSQIHPIPLDIEILQRCGFRFNSIQKEWVAPLGYSGFVSSKFVFHTCNEKPFDSDFTIVSCAEDGHSIPCKYLHQLQNIYFTVSGAELEFKPELSHA